MPWCFLKSRIETGNPTSRTLTGFTGLKDGPCCLKVVLHRNRNIFLNIYAVGRLQSREMLLIAMAC